MMSENIDFTIPAERPAFPGPLKNGKLDLSAVKRGVASFTFDDGVYKTWLPQMALFARYGARATFFYSGEITPEKAESMKVLRGYGHSVGLHTVRHKDAVDVEMNAYFEEQLRPQIDAAAACGVTDLRYFAYPNNRHSDETDAFLSRYFRRFRAGAGIKLPKGFWIAEQDNAYIPYADLPGRRVMGGCGIGAYYDSTVENLDAALTRAAEENLLIVFFSHGIYPGAKSVDMPTELLEHLLEKCSELGLLVAGFDEIPE